MENAADIVAVDDKKFKNEKGKEPETKEYQSYSLSGRQILQMTGERFQHFLCLSGRNCTAERYFAT